MPVDLLCCFEQVGLIHNVVAVEYDVVLNSISRDITLKRRWTKPLRGRPEGRSPAIAILLL